MNRRDAMTCASLAFVANTAAGAAMAVREDLPARWGGMRLGDSPARDFFLGWGTALSAPAWLLGPQLLATAALHLPRRPRTLGAAALAGLGVAYTVGMLGEPIAWQLLRRPSFDAPKAAIVAANVALPLTLVVLGLREVREEGAAA